MVRGQPPNEEKTMYFLLFTNADVWRIHLPSRDMGTSLLRPSRTGSSRTSPMDGLCVSLGGGTRVAAISWHWISRFHQGFAGCWGFLPRLAVMYRMYGTSRKSTRMCDAKPFRFAQFINNATANIHVFQGLWRNPQHPPNCANLKWSNFDWVRFQIFTNSR